MVTLPQIHIGCIRTCYPFTLGLPYITPFPHNHLKPTFSSNIDRFINNPLTDPSSNLDRTSYHPYVILTPFNVFLFSNNSKERERWKIKNLAPGCECNACPTTRYSTNSVIAFVFGASQSVILTAKVRCRAHLSLFQFEFEISRDTKTVGN